MKKPLKICIACLLASAIAASAAGCAVFGRPAGERAARTAERAGGSASASSVRIENDTVTLTAAGIYQLSGTLTNGRIVADTGDTVTLILDGADISNPEDAAFRVKNAEHVLIYLPDGSENRLVSGTEREITAADEDGSLHTAEGAALYAKADLSIAGGGSLRVGGYVNNGIASAGRLTVLGGTLDIEAVNNGLKGRDSVLIVDGALNVTGGRDGIRSNNGTDAGLGTVELRGGTVNVSAFGDGVRAERDLTVAGGSLTVTSADDCLRAGGNAAVTGGTLTLAAGNNGIRAADTLTIDGAEVTITRSYEGLEAHFLHIKGGDVSVTAADDGLNASGGEPMPALLITGGTLYVNAGGDGLDSNGDLIVEGGLVIIDGPSDDRNGALDYGSENGGVLLCGGGTILAVGGSGRAACFEAASAQPSFIHCFSGGLAAGSEITVRDADGSVLFTHVAAKAFSSVVFSSADLTVGSAVTLTAGGQSAEIRIGAITNGDPAGGLK